MTAEEARHRLSLEAEIWVLKLALCRVFQEMGFTEDWETFRHYLSENFDVHKDRLLTELEDTDPALAAAIDDRESIPASVPL
jgi:hypothetical protein